MRLNRRRGGESGREGADGMMTPGLAGFIASGEESQTSNVVAEVLETLGQDFELIPERAATRGVRRRTWFDTFDWRLYKAGLTLEYAAAHRGGELRLSDSGAAPPTETVQPVTGWQAARPHQLRDLPDGPIATSIGGVIAPRALLPEVTVAGTTAAYRLLNEDGKTVARLLVEYPAVAAGDGQPLPPRLTITEVRGYNGQARRAARIVAGIP